MSAGQVRVMLAADGSPVNVTRVVGDQVMAVIWQRPVSASDGPFTYVVEVAPQDGPRLVDVHEHLRSRARKPGPKLALPGSEMERPLPTSGVTIDPNWRQRVGEQIVGVETVRSLGLSAGHDPRYQVGPDEQVPAVFSGRKYGEYTDPASTWAMAAMRGAA